MGKKVGIIGAGIGGLLACKYTLSKGYNPIVFEALDNIGGVWAKTLTNSTKLQSPKLLYQFSDFSWPSNVEDNFPKGDQVLDYIKSYAKHFDLIRHIRFNNKVISIKYKGASHECMKCWTLWSQNGEPFGNQGKWLLTVLQNIHLSLEVIEVDFVILCLGRFSGVPNIPNFPIGKEPQASKAKVLHSMEYSSLEYESATNLVEANRVFVVGFGKTAMDIAMKCASLNGLENPCTMIYRNSHWNVPESLLWRFPLKYVYLNRFAELWVRKPHDCLFILLLAFIISPLKWAICKVMERKLRHLHELDKLDTLPKKSFLEEMNGCEITTVPQGFYDKVKEGSIILKKCSSFHFCKEGIILINNNNDYQSQSQVLSLINTDLVILATGFNGEQKLKHIFESPNFQDYIMCPKSNTLVPLYRECIHPQIPQLAIIGFSDSLANLYSSELRCRWLAELFAGKFKLPKIQDMERDISIIDKLIKKNSKNISNTKKCIGALHIWQNDQLCKDMGWNPKRKNGFLAEWFQPYGPMDYV